MGCVTVVEPGFLGEVTGRDLRLEFNSFADGHCYEVFVKPEYRSLVGGHAGAYPTFDKLFRINKDLFDEEMFSLVRASDVAGAWGFSTSGKYQAGEVFSIALSKSYNLYPVGSLGRHFIVGGGVSRFMRGLVNCPEAELEHRLGVERTRLVSANVLDRAFVGVKGSVRLLQGAAGMVANAFTQPDLSQFAFAVDGMRHILVHGEKPIRDMMVLPGGVDGETLLLTQPSVDGRVGVNLFHDAVEGRSCWYLGPGYRSEVISVELEDGRLVPFPEKGGLCFWYSGGLSAVVRVRELHSLGCRVRAVETAEFASILESGRLVSCVDEIGADDDGGSNSVEVERVGSMPLRDGLCYLHVIRRDRRDYYYAMLGFSPTLRQLSKVLVTSDLWDFASYNVGVYETAGIAGAHAYHFSFGVASGRYVGKFSECMLGLAQDEPSMIELGLGLNGPSVRGMDPDRVVGMPGLGVAASQPYSEVSDWMTKLFVETGLHVDGTMVVAAPAALGVDTVGELSLLEFSAGDVVSCYGSSISVVTDRLGLLVKGPLPSLYGLARRVFKLSDRVAGSIPFSVSSLDGSFVVLGFPRMSPGVAAEAAAQGIGVDREIEVTGLRPLPVPDSVSLTLRSGSAIVGGLRFRPANPVVWIVSSIFVDGVMLAAVGGGNARVGVAPIGI